MNIDFNVLVFMIGSILALPIIGYAFRFNIPISIFFLLAGTLMIAIWLMTDGIILNDRPNIIFDNDTSFTINYEDNVMDLSFEGENHELKVFLIFLSSMFIVGGALIEVKQR